MNGSDFSYVPAAESCSKVACSSRGKAAAKLKRTLQAFNPFVAYDID